MRKHVGKLEDTQQSEAQSGNHVPKTTTHQHRTSAPTIEIEKLTQKRGTNRADETFKIIPDYAYPNVRMNREQLRIETSKPSSCFHDLRVPNKPSHNNIIGQISIETLQCFGIPYNEKGIKQSPFCLIVCGQYAFQTDCVVPITNPMWLCKMRRACHIPIHHAYARVYIGVLRQRIKSSASSSTTTSSSAANNERDAFIGRVVIDVARLRPNCTYDVTLPLRQSAHVYVKEQRGAIRFRFHLQYYSERMALLSYLPTDLTKIKIEPNESVTVYCCGVKSFQNVARVVHGIDMPDRFSMRRLQATMREINLTRIHVLRYLRKNEFRNLYQWRFPFISSFVFLAWMHSVYCGSVCYVPGHLITYLLLHLWKNYANYCGIIPSVHNGFTPPTWEELFMALIFNGNGTIEPFDMEVIGNDDDHEQRNDPNSSLHKPSSIKSQQSFGSTITGEFSLKDIAIAFEDGIQRQSLRYHFRVYHDVFKGTDAVTFLVQNGYATSREHAVMIGRRLAEGMKLFEHVARKHRFEDKPYFYIFSIYGRNQYVINTHKPWGGNIFQMLGFLSPLRMSNVAIKSQFLSEMPYTDGVDHPRFRVKEAVYLQTKIAKKALAHELEAEENAESDDEMDPQDFEHGLHMFLNQRDSVSDLNSVATDEDADTIQVQYLKKPPKQDMKIKNQNQKPIHAVLDEARHKVHGVLLHLFNDRAYKYPDKRQESIKKLSPARSTRNLTSKIKSQRHLDIDEDSEEDVCKEAIKNEYDKLLGVGRYSHPNVFISRLGLVVQPIIEIATGWLCLFRSLFNIFTWKDPILSFWISMFGPIMIIILHSFPWRLVFGIVGILVFGPQNWLLRVMRERRDGPDVYDPDKVIRKTRPEPQMEQHQHPVFSNHITGNEPTKHSFESEEEILSLGRIRQVVVPYSALMYSHRFYDWPPEGEYTRVSSVDGAMDKNSESSHSIYETNFSSLPSINLPRSQSFDAFDSNQNNIDKVSYENTHDASTRIVTGPKNRWGLLKAKLRQRKGIHSSSTIESNLTAHQL
jgi:hypothetical protein